MEPFGTEELEAGAAVGVPSEVWTFRLAGGKPAAGGAFFLLLKRNAIVRDFATLRLGR